MKTFTKPLALSLALSAALAAPAWADPAPGAAAGKLGDDTPAVLQAARSTVHTAAGSHQAAPSGAAPG